MKKILVTLLSCVLLSCTFIGCSSTSNNPETTVRIGSLKGPTSIGLMKLMDDSNQGKSKNSYSFEMAVTADEILPKMISNELDIALVPANVAAVLYNKTKGQTVVLDINTLGVLYAVSADSSITSMEDLKGKTVYVTNKGTTPDFVFQYLLSANGLSSADVNVEYKSEATEVAALLAKDDMAVGILPQPFVTVCCLQNDKLSPVLNLTGEWDNAPKESESRLVTGVTVVRKEFLENNKEAVDTFMEEHKASCEFVSTDVEKTASYMVASGMIEKKPIAKAAIPFCNVEYIDKEAMKAALEGYLKVLFDLDPSSVGGTMPSEDFYY